jgi:ATP-binding cassette subfamily A (ABC1) protein 3
MFPIFLSQAVDIVLYSVLAWYFSQVWPTKVGITKPFYFVFQPSYWFPAADSVYQEEELAEDAVMTKHGGSRVQSFTAGKFPDQQQQGEELKEADNISSSYSTSAFNTAYEDENEEIIIPVEQANEDLLGKPTVVVRNLSKSFGGQLAVNDLSFKMYENQIFALIGHNGAGKSTTINMLTGLFAPDAPGFCQTDTSTTKKKKKKSGAFVYGHNIATEMELIRYHLGICPQHNVFFENLTVREHILFFAQLKGYNYEDAETEAEHLTGFFDLENRLEHTGSELSGGQQRKLSVAIALCGGSRFVVLDEPTAGLDPLARRELWDLLASLRRGRTILLTTHYMDESEVLGDRVGIMSLGQMQCLGTPQFLKTTYGAGYKLIFDKPPDFTEEQLINLSRYVHSYIPEAKFFEEEGSEGQILYSLPFRSVDKFGTFFNALEAEGQQQSLNIISYGVTVTSLEDVFLKVGADKTVTPKIDTTQTIVDTHGIGKVGTTYDISLATQIVGIAKRKLVYAMNDFITLPLILLPVFTFIAAVILYNRRTISKLNAVNNLVVAGMFIISYVCAPGLIAEFLVRERRDNLRNVLIVMGCDFKAYWIGTFLADYLIMLIPTICLWIMWPAADMPDFYDRRNGLGLILMLIFNFQLIGFAYFFSFVFTNPKSCISLMPILVLALEVIPNVMILIIIQIATSSGSLHLKNDVIGGILLWCIMLMTPHGALFAGFLDTTYDYNVWLSNFPPVYVTIICMIFEGLIYLAITYYRDSRIVATMVPVEKDPTFDERLLTRLDDDVKDERERTLNPNYHNIENGNGGGGMLIGSPNQQQNSPMAAGVPPLRVCRLRKVFPPQREGLKAVVATEDIAFTVKSGEIFGLLGANGAGKTTTLSMITRMLLPTSGNAFVTGYSVLTEFPKASTHLGVVTQNNSLWDHLSVESHLQLFARLRGVPGEQVNNVVNATIDQLELTPHRNKLAMKLSGGMKRKLCVAIALIGDPEVVLLDEPSAGLDPVSRRNLWSVILKTMSQRAVILTTHSMEEAEALCQRIAIMVKGQIRALGTKQHLKHKFGSGYELSVKLRIQQKETLIEQMERLTRFVKELFPSSQLIAENGGLLTYQIPRQEMHMGKAFTALEANKTELEMEDYTIAQPTLEQVKEKMD